MFVSKHLVNSTPCIWMQYYPRKLPWHGSAWSPCITAWIYCVCRIVTFDISVCFGVISTARGGWVWQTGSRGECWQRQLNFVDGGCGVDAGDSLCKASDRQRRPWHEPHSFALLPHGTGKTWGLWHRWQRLLRHESPCPTGRPPAACTPRQLKSRHYMQTNHYCSAAPLVCHFCHLLRSTHQLQRYILRVDVYVAVLRIKSCFANSL